jgi:hypothetical protein
MHPHLTTGFYCYEGSCSRKPNPKVYASQPSLRQHRVRAHGCEPPQETSIGRVLKRTHEAEAEEARKRQRLEEEERIAASRILEPEPPRPVCHQALSSQENVLIFTDGQGPSP